MRRRFKFLGNTGVWRLLTSAARDIGERLDAKALVAYTQSGDTVRRLARSREPTPPKPTISSAHEVGSGIPTAATPTAPLLNESVPTVPRPELLIARELIAGNALIIVIRNDRQ